jgi:hypothetical protein
MEAVKDLKERSYEIVKYRTFELHSKGTGASLMLQKPMEPRAIKYWTAQKKEITTLYEFNKKLLSYITDGKEGV